MNSMRFCTLKKGFAFVFVCFTVAGLLAASALHGQGVERMPLEDTRQVDIRDSMKEGEKDLKELYSYITAYRVGNSGNYPKNIGDILKDIYEKEGGIEKQKAVARELRNPDAKYADDNFVRSNYEKVIPYSMFGARLDGSPNGGPKIEGTRDVLAYTTIYAHNAPIKTQKGNEVANPTGYYLTLWDDGNVFPVPFDEIIYVINGERAYMAFYGQAGIPSDRSLSYQEFWTKDSSSRALRVGKPIPRGKEEPVLDNGGPEALVTLSRLLNFPDRYGIEREKMWQVFDPDQAEFTLEEVQAGAAKLGLALQTRKLSLDDLQKLNSPAILYLSDTSRLVTLASLDTQQATVLDQGITRIVSRDVLARRYSGQALVPARATQAQSGIDVDDAVRELELTDASQEVTQQVTITNTGRSALMLQVEHPIPGVTKAELSSATVAPGQKATLNLTLKWRQVLKGDTQNVFVFVRTNDPLRPRLQLGFQLRVRQA